MDTLLLIIDATFVTVPIVCICTDGQRTILYQGCSNLFLIFWELDETVNLEKNVIGLFVRALLGADMSVRIIFLILNPETIVNQPLHGKSGGTTFAANICVTFANTCVFAGAH